MANMPKVPIHFTKPTLKTHTPAVLDADQQYQWLKTIPSHPTSLIRRTARTIPTTMTLRPQVQRALLPGAEGPDGEKGLGSTVAGGAAGGHAAHKTGGGKLATARGAVVGAVGMNVVSHKLKQNNNQKTAQTAAVVPVTATPAFGATTILTNDGLGGGLGLGRAHRRIARRRLGL